MAFESLKYPRNREILKPTKENIKLLHNSVEFILPPQSILNNNPNKKFYLKVKGENTWPNITILSQDSDYNREVRISLHNSSTSKNNNFSYLLSREQQILPTGEGFIDFLDEDSRIFEDKCGNIKKSLLKAKELNIYDGWDAIPDGSSLRYIPQPFKEVRREGLGLEWRTCTSLKGVLSPLHSTLLGLLRRQFLLLIKMKIASSWRCVYWLKLMATTTALSYILVGAVFANFVPTAIFGFPIRTRTSPFIIATLIFPGGMMEIEAIFGGVVTA